MSVAVQNVVADYWVAFRSDDPSRLHRCATALVQSNEHPESAAYHSALFVLLHHGDLTEVKAAIDRALTANGDTCAASLLPVLAHVHQRLQEIQTAQTLFEECERRGFLTGRNAFLANTAIGVAFAAAYTSSDEGTLVERAHRLLTSGEDPASALFHAALCTLLSRGDVEGARLAIETALATQETSAPHLLPLLAHAFQRLDDLQRADALFEECRRGGFLSGRNAFLIPTADAVAFTAAYQRDDEQEIAARARRFVERGDAPTSEVFHAALMALLTRGHIRFVKESIERAFETGFEACRSLLLPVLAHAHQRLYDIETAHELYQSCERLGLLTGRNAFLAQSATDVTFAVAELAMHRARAAHECNGDTAALQAGTVVARALYAGAFAEARARAAQGGPSIISRAMPVDGRKPDFIIAGSAKCGTTFLYDLLGRSPSVWSRSPKELHYFTSMHRFGDAFYSQFFELCPDGLLCGESSPDYLDDCRQGWPIDERIQACCPDAKIIVVLRDPALRAISWYNQMTTNDAGRGGRPGNRRLNDLTMEQLSTYRGGAALIQGAFVNPLRRFARTFGRERLLILTFEELIDVERVSPRVSTFLDIAPPVLGAKAGDRNAGGHDKPSDEFYAALREHFRESLDALEQEFGIRL